MIFLIKIFLNFNSYFKIARCFLINEQDIQINEAIKEKKIRVIDESGKQLGIINTIEALTLAERKNLDLVKIAPLANPPVCKIMNYGKFKFDQSKRLKESKKSQKSISVKEIRISLNINIHDLETKIKSAIKFLNSNNKVKICVKFKGREMLRTQAGFELINQVTQACENFGAIEKNAKLEGKNLAVTIIHKTQKKTNSNKTQIPPNKIDVTEKK